MFGSYYNQKKGSERQIQKDILSNPWRAPLKTGGTVRECLLNWAKQKSFCFPEDPLGIKYKFRTDFHSIWLVTFFRIFFFLDWMMCKPANLDFLLNFKVDCVPVEATDFRKTSLQKMDNLLHATQWAHCATNSGEQMILSAYVTRKLQIFITCISEEMEQQQWKIKVIKSGNMEMLGIIKPKLKN